MGLLFLRTIGLVKTIDYKIGCKNNRMNGLVQIKDNQTPTNNPQSTSQRTKNKTRTRSQYKAQHKNTKKEQKGKHTTTPNRPHTNQ